MKQLVQMLFLGTCFTLVWLGCKKDKTELPDADPGTGPTEKVKAIEWDNGIKATIDYWQGNQVKSINYNYLGSIDTVSFGWENGKLKSMYENRSLYKHEFSFDGSLVTDQTVALKQGNLSTSYSLVFTYLAGRLAMMKYFTKNEAGTVLKSTSTYAYNSAGELQSVTTTAGTSIITHTIEAYSPAVNFNPALFLETTLSEYYPVYNLAVLSTMKKLPAKIVRSVKEGNNQPYVDKITTTAFEIENKRLNKSTTTITVPGMPQYASTETATFFY